MVQVSAHIRSTQLPPLHFWKGPQAWQRLPEAPQARSPVPPRQSSSAVQQPLQELELQTQAPEAHS